MADNQETTPLETNLQVLVKQKLVDSGSKVHNLLVEKLVDTEISDRVEKSLTVYQKLEELKKERFKKDKPDTEYFDATKTKIETFSKTRIEELDKLDVEIKKYEDALKIAFEKSDFTKVKELTQKKG